jgi:hypothetical protein
MQQMDFTSGLWRAGQRGRRRWRLASGLGRAGGWHVGAVRRGVVRPGAGASGPAARGWPGGGEDARAWWRR